MDNLKFEQNRLRHDLVEEVKRYLGYAEDVHADYISVNETNFDVDFRSRNDENRKSDLEYYDILGLIERDGLWFKPDTDAIEAIVQEHLPSPNIKAKFDEWCESIKSFLVAEQPCSLKSCRFSIGTSSLSLDCFDEDKDPIEEGTEHTYEEEMEDEWESVDVEPMRKAVTKTATGYTISAYNLTTLILNYTKPE